VPSPSTPRHAATNPLLESVLRRGMGAIGRQFPPISGWFGFQLFATPIRGYYQVPEADKVLLGKAKSAKIHTWMDGQRCALQVYVWGDELGPDQAQDQSDRPTILLLHGWMSSSAQMTNFVEPLLAQGFRVIALDGPAHGNSSLWQTNLRQFGQGIQAVLRQFGPLHGFIGHSFGAAASLLLLYEHKSVTRLMLPRLTLIASPAETQFMMHVIARAIGGCDRVEANMQQRFLRHYGLPIEFFSLPKMAASISASVPLPGLVIHDQDDQLIPFEQGEAIARAWPGAEFMATAGLGHGDILRDATVVERVVQFQVQAQAQRQPEESRHDHRSVATENLHR
jgi:pimeloyl-ACP methyl ester carboxylesterase